MSYIINAKRVDPSPSTLRHDPTIPPGFAAGALPPTTEVVGFPPQTPFR